MATLGRAALFIETRLMPLFYVYLAGDRAYSMFMQRDGIRTAALGLLRSSGPQARFYALTLFIHAARFTMIPFCAMVIYGLTRAKPKPRPFESRAEIVVPLMSFLISACSDFLINTIGSLHDVMDDRMIQLTPGLLAASYALIAAGRALSAGGIWSLGTSFAVLVEAREAVTHGLYKYLRHPIYAGYTLSLAGLLLRRPTPAKAVYVAASVALYVVRASIEERRLSREFPEYRARRRRK